MAKTGSKTGLLQEQSGRNNNRGVLQLYQELQAVSNPIMVVSTPSHLPSREIDQLQVHRLDNHHSNQPLIGIIEKSSNPMSMVV